MKFQIRVAVIAGALALSAAPALAVGPTDNPGTSHVPDNPGTTHVPSDPSGGNAPTTTPGPSASLPSKAKAYGTYCSTESKQHVDGTPGTPFSTCVTAMAKLANDQANNPRTACQDESKQHVAGAKGTPFSQCVSGGRHLVEDLNAE